MSVAAQIPGPAWHEIVNNAISFRQAPLSFLEDLQRKYGDFAHFRLGPWHAYLIMNPQDIATVMAQPDLFYKDKVTRTIIKPFFGDGLGLSNGAIHKRNRKMVAPAFYHSRIKLYAQVMNDYVQRMVDSWQEGQEVLLEPTLTDLTLRIIGKTMFNSEVESTPELFHAMENIILVLGAKLREPIPLPKFVPTQNNRRMEKALKLLDEVVYRIIAEHHEKGSDQGNALSMMLDAVDEDGKPLSEQSLRDEVMTLLIGGHETTAHLLTWAFYMLDKHPEMLQIVEQEIDAVLQGRNPTLEDVSKFGYTQMFVKETLRLYPPVWLTCREPNDDVNIGGRQIKKGSLVFFSPYMNHHDERSFENPEEFRPERFANSAEKKWPNYQYFPFGGGARICLGQEYAMVETVLILTTIVSKVRLQRTDTHEVGKVYAATMRPDDQIAVRVKLREPRTFESTECPVVHESAEAGCPVIHTSVDRLERDSQQS